MKKSLLALAVAAFAATAANAAAVYEKDGTELNIGGEVEIMGGNANGYFADGKAGHDSTTRDRARLSMDGRTQITSGIAAYGFYEWEVNHDGDSKEAQDLNARYSYVGVDFGAFGKVQAGRYEDPFEYASNVVDNLEEVGVYGGMDERNSGNLSYMWSGFGFDAGVNYQFAVDKYNADDYFGDFDVNNGWSAYAGYTSPSVLFGPISIRAAYQYLSGQHEHEVSGNDWYHDDENDIDTTEGRYIKNIKTYDLGLSWGNFGEGLYLATNFSHSRATGSRDGNYSQQTVRAWESMISYGFDMGVVLSAAYSDIKVTSNEEGLNDDDVRHYEDSHKRYTSLVASYDINENFRVWAEGILDNGSTDGEGVFQKSNDKNMDGFLVGARYTF